MGCLLASQYPLSEPRAPGPLHSVLGGPPSQPPAQWVRRAPEMGCGPCSANPTVDLEGVHLPLDT